MKLNKTETRLLKEAASNNGVAYFCGLREVGAARSLERKGLVQITKWTQSTTNDFEQGQRQYWSGALTTTHPLMDEEAAAPWDDIRHAEKRDTH